MNTGTKGEEDQFNREDRKVIKRIAGWLTDRKKLIVMGVGNPLKGDDAIGIMVVRELEKHKNALQEEVIFINCETVPENYLYTIREEKPSHLMLIDAVDAGIEPGSLIFSEVRKQEELAVSTHSLPLSVLADFLRNLMDVKVILLGIQVADLSFREGLSKSLTGMPGKIALMLVEALEINS